jgi:hypothetical protein
VPDFAPYAEGGFEPDQPSKERVYRQSPAPKANKSQGRPPKKAKKSQGEALRKAKESQQKPMKAKVSKGRPAAQTAGPAAATEPAIPPS